MERSISVDMEDRYVAIAFFVVLFVTSFYFVAVIIGIAWSSYIAGVWMVI
jgi:hypothetical protein